MRKALKFIIPAICIIVIAVTFNMIYDIQQKIEEENYGTENIAVDEENIVEDNVIDGENTATENTTANNINAQNVVEDDNVVTEEDDKLSTNRQERAIDLVEAYWGEDSTVYFTNEGINSKGEYIVAVRQKTSTAVKDYFKVNLDTKSVEIDY